MQARSLIVEDIKNLKEKIVELKDTFNPSVGIFFNSITHDVMTLHTTLKESGIEFLGATTAGEIALKSGEEGFTVSYRCNRYILPPAFKEKTTCDQSQISSRFLEPAIWDIVYQVLLDPKVLISALEKEFKGERNEHTTRKIAFLEKQIKASKFEDEKLYRAYLAEVFDETEFATRRKLVKEKEKKLSEELKKITKSLISPEHFEARKKAILLICNNAKENGLADNAPFEIKKNIIKTVIEKITLNVNEGWFELEGVIQGKYPIYKDGKKPFRRKARKNLVPVPNNF